MSTELYHRRLAYYAGRGGVAKEGDLVLNLRSAPPVFPNLFEIDFGEIHPGSVLFPPFMRLSSNSKRRDMTADEITAVRAWLAGLLSATMSAAGSPPAPIDRRRQ